MAGMRRILLYFIFGRRLLRRYIRLWAKYRRQHRALDTIEKRHRTDKAILRAGKDREIRRLGELVESYRNKIEIVQREAVDRNLEIMRLVGISYATREIDDRIQTLRFQPYDDAARAAQVEKGLYFTLTPEMRQKYDEQFENHRQIGLAEGHNEADIKQVWRDNEERIVMEILES